MGYSIQYVINVVNVRGCGSYGGECQIKIGKWVELDEGFNKDKQVTYCGEYNMEGIKVGRWEISFCDTDGEGGYKQIGGGSYGEEEAEIKIGMWIELDEWFRWYKQVTYSGEYNMKGMKVGRWDTSYCITDGDGEYRQIGGGSYDEGDGKGQIKIGRWIELDEGFKWYKQITYSGEYNMKGMKVGRWDTSYCLSENFKYKQIGGGFYGEGQIKIGKWVELNEGFRDIEQIIYSGKYNQKGMKVGRWYISYCDGDEEYRQIGGGSYDEEQGEIKIGKWIELDEGFNWYKQITYGGEYNMKGFKVGRWDIWSQKPYGNKESKKIGGGSYDEGDGQIKIGRWIELDELFCSWDKQEIIHIGEYDIRGMKIGKWVQYDIRENEKFDQKLHYQ